MQSFATDFAGPSDAELAAAHVALVAPLVLLAFGKVFGASKSSSRSMSWVWPALLGWELYLVGLVHSPNDSLWWERAAMLKAYTATFLTALAVDWFTSSASFQEEADQLESDLDESEDEEDDEDSDDKGESNSEDDGEDDDEDESSSEDEDDDNAKDKDDGVQKSLSESDTNEDSSDDVCEIGEDEDDTVGSSSSEEVAQQ